MTEATEKVGNTTKTKEEFQEAIKYKTNNQLRNKIRLGAFLQTNFAENEMDDPRTEIAVASLQEQIELLQKELVRRQEELIELQGKYRQAPAKKKPPAGPLDQVVGVKSLKLSGKNDMG